MIETNIELSDKLNLGETQIPFGEIHKRFALSRYGRTLEDSVRYHIFRPPQVSPQDWERVLGPDANNLHHLLVSYQITAGFIMECGARYFPSMKEREDLQLTAITHDWGEAVMGDISLGLKTPENEKMEILALKQIARELAMRGRGGQDLYDRICEVTDEIAFNPNTKLGRAFNAIEKVGYLKTGLEAWKQLGKAPPDSPLFFGLNILTHKVIGNQLEDILEYADEYLAVALFLQRNASTLTEVFNEMPLSIIEPAVEGRFPEASINFARSEALWAKGREKFSKS